MVALLATWERLLLSTELCSNSMFPSIRMYVSAVYGSWDSISGGSAPCVIVSGLVF